MILSLLDTIVKTQIKFTEYTELNFNQEYQVIDFKDEINRIKKLNNIKLFHNPRTMVFDCIGIIDINNVRHIDLDDTRFTLTNKGIDIQTEMMV